MSGLARVVPAILTDDPVKLEAMVRKAEGFAAYVQFDIMDGEFVPSRSITGDHLRALAPTFEWEAHLMVVRPEDYLERFKRAGARRVVFHYEATPSPSGVISLARKLGLGVGLALNPDTPVSAVLSLVDSVDIVLFLSVHPGFYGSKFIPQVLDKIKELRQARPAVEIGIDGGVKESNIASVVRSGVDVIYVGSGVFLEPSPAESLRHLQDLAEKAYRHSGG